MLADLAAVAGCALIVAGVFLVSLPAALIVAGALTIALAWRLA